MHLTRRTFTATSLATVATATIHHAAAGQATPQATPADTAIAEKISAVLEKYGVPGAVVGINDSASGNTLLLPVGIADVTTGEAMSTEMHFRIASVTKPFVSTIVLQLVDEGLVDLDATVDTYLPDLDIVNIDSVTVRNLLQMRSGLPHIETNPDFTNALVADPSRQYSLEELYRYVAAEPAMAEPDTAFDYNNLNYNILGDIIEKISGAPWEQALQARILDPLALTGTSMPGVVDLPAPHPRGYGYLDQDMSAVTGTPAAEATPVSNEIQATPVSGDMQPVDETGIYDLTDFHPSIAGAAGGMVSTIADMLTWAPALANGNLVSAEMHEQQITTMPMDDSGQIGYGLGLFDISGLIGHNGAINGFQSLVLSSPEYGVDIAVLSNCHPTIGWGDVGFEIATALLNG